MKQATSAECWFLAWGWLWVCALVASGCSDAASRTPGSDEEGEGDTLQEEAGPPEGHDELPGESGETDESSDSDVASPPPPGDLDMIRGVCAAQARWLCDALHSCGCPGTDQHEGCESRATASCVQRLRAQRFDRSERWTVERSWFGPCVEAWSLSLLDCAAPRNDLAQMSCAGFLSLEARVGERCRTPGAPCDGGQGRCEGERCVLAAGRGEPCAAPVGAHDGCVAGTLCVEGVCGEPGSRGERCSDDRACADGLVCVQETCIPLAAPQGACDESASCPAAHRCVGGQCVAGDAAGCAGVGPSAACGRSGTCGAPARLRCVAPAPLGSPCVQQDQCGLGAYCDTASGRCEPLPIVGSPCAEGVYCAEGLACTLDGAVCQPLPGEGEPCALVEAGPIGCAAGLACVYGDGQRETLCGPPPTAGEPCAAGGGCAEGLACAFEGQDNLCRAPRPPGSHCGSDANCVAGTHCDFGSGRCRPHYSLGQACRVGNECGPVGACLPSEGGLACAPLPQEGDGCLLGCASPFACVLERDALACYPALCALVSPP